MSDVLAGQVLHLQWNAYSTTWGPVLRDLRAAGLFHDLTLVTADNQLVTAHKIVLAACSQFFRGLLASLPMQTTGPLSPAVLYMRGVTGAALLKLLDFMYNGEVNVEQQLLKEFLQLGEDLRVQGLCEELAEKREEVVKETMDSKKKERKEGGGKERHRSYSEKEKILISEKMEKKVKHGHVHKESVVELNDSTLERNGGGARKEFIERKASKREFEEEASAIKSEVEMFDSPGEELEAGLDKEERMLGDKERRTPTPRKKIRKLKSLEEQKDDAINRDVLTMDPGEAHGILKLIENLDHIEENSEDLNIFVQLLNQLILKSNIANNVLYFCGICQKSLKSKQHMVNHVEANHVTGVYHNCGECGAKMKTRSSLFSHKNKNHKVHKKDSPDNKTDSLVLQNKSEILPKTELVLNKSESVQIRPEFTPRRMENVQNSFNPTADAVEQIDTHHADETVNHYSSEAEFE